MEKRGCVKTETYPDSGEDIAIEGTRPRDVTECYEVVYDSEHLVRDCVKAVVRGQPQHIYFYKGIFVTKQTVADPFDEFVEDWYRDSFQRLSGKAMEKIYYSSIRLDRSKISIGKLVEKKTVNHRCSRNVKAWNSPPCMPTVPGIRRPKNLPQEPATTPFLPLKLHTGRLKPAGTAIS